MRNLLALALLLAAIPACNAVLGIDEPTLVASLDDDDDTRTDCLLPSDCNDGQTCVFEVCSPPCQADRDCLDAERCLQLAGGSACVATGNAGCARPSDCPDGSICSDGECRNECVVLDAGMPNDDAGSQCLSDQQCLQGVCRSTDPDRDPNGDAGGATVDGGSENGECSHGALRCDGHALAARSFCREGAWEAGDPCPDGQLCDTEAEVAGTCRTLVEECFGREPGAGFCAGATRITCGPDLVTSTEETCASIQHCINVQQGCAACLPNEHACSGQILRECNDDLSGFDTVTDCAQTSEPCNAQAGACTSDACLENQKRCIDDELQICNEDQSAFELFQNCGTGLCDSATLTCDDCLAGQTSCGDDTTRSQCNDEGTDSTDTACMGSMPFCASGNCVQCLEADDCTVGDCQVAGCNGSGQCAPSNQNQGTACDEGGGSVCDNAGNCVECNVPNDCGTTNACYEPDCNGESCSEAPKNARVACNFAGGVMCDGAGNCVECVDEGDCDPDNDCYTATCDGSCGQIPKNEGTACPVTGVCDGDGACVQCTPTYDGNCSMTQVCRDFSCTNAVETHGWEDSLASTSNPATGVLYWLKLPTLPYDATLVGFGVVGTETGSNYKLALYNDNGSGTAAAAEPPIAATVTEIALANDTVETTSVTPANVSLVGGATYWLAFKASVQKYIRAAGNAQQLGFRAATTYGAAFPNNPHSLAPLFTQNGTEFAVFIRVHYTE